MVLGPGARALAPALPDSGMPSSARSRALAPAAWWAALAGLLAAVLALALLAGVAALRSERDGELTAESLAAVAQAYEALRTLLLQQEVTRHDLLLRGGDPAVLGEPARAGARRPGPGGRGRAADASREHAAALDRLRAAEDAYQAAVDAQVRSPGDAAAEDEVTDAQLLVVASIIDEEVIKHQEDLRDRAGQHAPDPAAGRDGAAARRAAGRRRGRRVRARRRAPAAGPGPAAHRRARAVPHRQPHRARQPGRLHRRAAPAPARRPARRAGRPAAARPRRLQAGERHLRPFRSATRC